MDERRPSSGGGVQSMIEPAAEPRERMDDASEGNARVTLPKRMAGVLLHPSALPGRFAIGDLGPSAHRFLDWLAAAGQQVWQMLPINPPGHGNSPYAAPSTFAGSPLLVSPEVLRDAGLLTADEVEEAVKEAPATGPVDFAAAADQKRALLERAFRRFRAAGGSRKLGELRVKEASWLPDYALFMALKEEDPRHFSEWSPELARHAKAAFSAAERRLSDRILYHGFTQLCFAQQWQALREHAERVGVQLFGDMPIFPADDSADVWANQGLFHLDDRGRPTHVAGVPPDYFSETGQRWGNPVYRWDAVAADGYRYWIERFRRAFALMDLIRVDHFRGFEASWHVPVAESTAVRGKWVKGPGRELFLRAEAALGRLPIVAEDLGLITPAVERLRDELGFPGMKVLHFAFGGDPRHPFLPHEHSRRAVVYTGTHDNDTTAGWFGSLTESERERVRGYAGVGELADPVRAMIRLAYGSVAELAVVPLQDVLGLGSEARMNVPSEPEGNWTWRFAWSQLSPDRAAWLCSLAHTYGRLPAPTEG
jgi:4-alpha-glucanotransferase